MEAEKKGLMIRLAADASAQDVAPTGAGAEHDGAISTCDAVAEFTMSDNNGSSTGWGGWIVAIVVGAVLLWHFNRKPEPTPVTLPKDLVTTAKQNPPQPEKPRVDYDKLSAQELLAEARAAGLDPK
jgi:hypothetical protein